MTMTVGEVRASMKQAVRGSTRDMERTLDWLIDAASVMAIASVTSAALSIIPDSVSAVSINRYSTGTPWCPAPYVRVENEPLHDLKFYNGGWWEIAPHVADIDTRMAGAMVDDQTVFDDDAETQTNDDGATDDTAAILRAIAVGRNVYLPPGMSAFSDTLDTVASGQTIWGEYRKSILRCTATNKTGIRVLHPSCMVSRVHLRDIVAADSNEYWGIVFGEIADDCVIELCYTHNTADAGIRAVQVGDPEHTGRYAKRVRILFNTVAKWVDGAGIEVIAAEAPLVHGNYVLGGGSHTGIRMVDTYRGKCTGNWIIGFDLNGITCAAGSLRGQAYDNSITDNFVYTANGGATVAIRGGGDTINLTIANNTIVLPDGASTVVGIGIWGAGNASEFDYKNVNVSNNIILGGYKSIEVKTTIGGANKNSVSISNNSPRNPVHSCLHVIDGDVACVVTGNVWDSSANHDANTRLVVLPGPNPLTYVGNMAANNASEGRLLTYGGSDWRTLEVTKNRLAGLLYCPTVNTVHPIYPPALSSITTNRTGRVYLRLAATTELLEGDYLTGGSAAIATSRMHSSLEVGTGTPTGTTGTSGKAGLYAATADNLLRFENRRAGTARYFIELCGC